MLKRELKINLKSFLIWTSIMLFMFLIVYLMYPAIVNSDSVAMMDEMMKMFPDEVIKAFNMDISSMDSAFGWLKTEGFVFIFLITGVYASIMGSSILLKEESEKTIEYLNSLPVRRKDILKNKVICGIFYIVLMIIIIGLFNYIGLELSGDFDRKQFILLSITPLFIALPLFTINLFISTISKKTKKTFGIALGISFISYFLSIISELSKETEFFKYFTVYTLGDIRNVIIDVSINPIMIFIAVGISLLFIILSFVKYEKKELV
ncbi:MAG: ABC transporter permease subunit [Bacilli bacterium]|nr:ABC transporter permease subunit [Bacilli bacterium]